MLTTSENFLQIGIGRPPSRIFFEEDRTCRRTYFVIG